MPTGTDRARSARLYDGSMPSVATLRAAVQVIHPGPTLAVVALSAALGAILLVQAGVALDIRWLATVAAVLGSQVFTGTTNDLVDRGRDQATARLDKPLAIGALDPETAVWIASGGLALQLAASLQLGALFLWLGVAATGSALAYNLWLSRTPLSVVPYIVSFGLLAPWIAAGVGVPLDRVAAAPVLVAPFAAAAHLTNALRDFEPDAQLGSRNLAQVIGERRAFWLAWGLAMGVGIGVGVAFILGGKLDPVGAVLGVAGLAAVAQGFGGPERLWPGMLVAAVCWTAAWALGSG
jgi:4-hydroxybenzoate polyprenyltransferase